uniref:uncharacterized protein LOC120342940 isoform X1 n=2 Tax=Styela clava TaxID=7725 RepID=UPI0019393C2A|nr:uncharacterized protein LOC120342940 isoform X1 [Styela clava]
MDLKRLQEELKSDIIHHQALMQMLKKNPADQAIRLKLKAVQKHIAELGSQQKKIASASRSSPSTSETEASSSHTSPLKTENASNIKSKQSYTLITIKNGSQPVYTSNNQTISGPSYIGNSNRPVNLSKLPGKSLNAVDKPFVPQSAVLVVTTPSQISVNKPAIKATVPAPIPISLSSLVSSGGVVTLPGSWKSSGTQAATVKNTKVMADAIGRLVPTKQVQIKVPVVQSPGSNPVIIMPQKTPMNNQPKSLFRLLPKGCHPIPVNPQGTVITRGPQLMLPTNQGNIAAKVPVTQKAGFPTIIMPSDSMINKTGAPLQQVLVQRVGHRSTVPTPTSVTWQDLSSRTPAIHKPSYVPRKSYPNINNGVGSFQKFRILDGKAQILSKTHQESTQGHPSAQVGNQDKPRNSALKAVLTSKPVATTSGMVTLARLVPPVPGNSFFPIRTQDTVTGTQGSVMEKRSIKLATNDSPFIPVPVTKISSISNIRQSSLDESTDSIKRSDTPVDEEAKEKLQYLRNIDLIPKSQANQVRRRRFRKRRVAANPIYSGGMYISNDHEPKRHCPDVMASALECITAPDVIVKRPRGRPRGSKNTSTLAAQKASTSTRNIRSNSSTSPLMPTHVEEIKQLRGILDVVASASEAVTSAGISSADMEVQDLSRHPSRPLPNSSPFVGPQSLSGVRSKSTELERPESRGDEHEDQCAICGKTGEVLMCDTCSRVYHLSCATPPLSTVPQGMWICSKCKNNFKYNKSKTAWSGIVTAVHSYWEHDEQRDLDIAKHQDKLDGVKKVVAALQMQTKSLTNAVMGKVNLRSKAMREKHSLEKEIVDFSTIFQNVWKLQAQGHTG